MGNGQTKSAQTIIANKKKSFSFDVGDFNNFNMDKIKPTNVMNSSNYNKNNNLLNNHNHISSSLDMKTSHNNDAHIMPSLMNRQSSSVIEMVRPKMTLKQQNAKLQKLNKNNDQLRKQLIEINQKLAVQLQKKKIIKVSNNPNSSNGGNKKRSLSKQSQARTEQHKSQQKAPKQKQKDKFKIIALKKQLQNAYNQITNYKKQLQILKKNQSSESNIKIFQYQDKITLIDQQIGIVQKSLTSTRDIVDKQRKAIGQFQSEMGGREVEEMKKEIVVMKERLKQIKEISRKKEKDQKMRHQLLIQMERKLREVNGQYLPEFKNWANEVPQGIRQSRISTSVVKNSRVKTKGNYSQNQKDQQTFSGIIKQIPTEKQFTLLLQQHKQNKKTHQQMNKRMYNQIRKKNQYKQQRQRMEEKLLLLQKTIQGLNYKKERYLQIIMANVELMNNGNNINSSGRGNYNLTTVMNYGEDEDEDNNNSLSRHNHTTATKSIQPITITKGQDVNGQVEFSDKKIIKNYQQIVNKLKIITVNIWTNQQQDIIAMQFFYTDEQSFFVGMKSSDIKVVTEKKTLELQQGDFVQNVMGIFNSKTKYLEFIVFQSANKKVLKVGRQSFKNSSFNLGLGKIQRLAMISGACVFDGSSWRINKLQFVIKG